MAPPASFLAFFCFSSLFASTLVLGAKVIWDVKISYDYVYSLERGKQQLSKGYTQSYQILASHINLGPISEECKTEKKNQKQIEVKKTKNYFWESRLRRWLPKTDRTPVKGITMYIQQKARVALFPTSIDTPMVISLYIRLRRGSLKVAAVVFLFKKKKMAEFGFFL